MAPRNRRLRRAAGGSGVLLAAAAGAWPAVETLREMRDVCSTDVLVLALLVSQGAIAAVIILARRKRRREQSLWRDSGGAVIAGGGECGCEARVREVEWRLHLYSEALTAAFAEAGGQDPPSGDRRLRAVSGDQA